MDIIRITGVPPYDGDYEADLSRFTNGELRTIKRVSGVVAAQLQAALNEGDQDAFVGVCVVVLERAGKVVVVDILWDADADAIEFIEGEDEDEDAGSAEGNSPPPSEPDGPSEPDAATPSSGESSSEKLDAQVLNLPATGTQG